MKTIVTKSQVQSAAIGTVKLVAVPLHMSVQLAANILNSVADGIAIGEGKVTHLIDESKSEETVAKARVQYTDDKFQEASFMVLLAKAKLQQAMYDADKAIDKSIAKVKDTVSNTVDKSKEVINKIIPHEASLPTMTPEQAFGTETVNMVNEPFVAPAGWRVKAMK